MLPSINEASEDDDLHYQTTSHPSHIALIVTDVKNGVLSLTSLRLANVDRTRSVLLHPLGFLLLPRPWCSITTVVHWLKEASPTFLLLVSVFFDSNANSHTE